MHPNLSSPVTSDYYTRQDIFDREIEEVFRPSWVCVGFTDDLSQPGDFVTTQIGRYNVVVQNFAGTLRAFRNVCSHRFSRIQCDRKGNRSLTCPYHGWTYDAEGVPAGIPANREAFGFDEADRRSLALESYALEVCGRFVFVRMSRDGPDLRTFLCDVYGVLEHLTETCPDRFDSQQIEWDFNWKIGMDNAAEGYHVPLVHPESFALMLKPGLRLSTSGEHGWYIGDLKDRSNAWWAGVAKAIGLKPSPVYTQYASFLIFPNIVINFSYGGFLAFQTFDPLGVEKLAINAGAWLAHNKGGAARDMVVEQLKDFSQRVRAEDRAICRKVQDGLNELDGPRVMLTGRMEQATAHFHQAYAARMTGNRLKVAQ